MSNLDLKLIFSSENLFYWGGANYALKNLNLDYNNFPESESYYSEAITIPLYPTMSSHDQDLVVQAIKDSI